MHDLSLLVEIPLLVSGGADAVPQHHLPALRPQTQLLMLNGFVLREGKRLQYTEEGRGRANVCSRVTIQRYIMVLGGNFGL